MKTCWASDLGPCAGGLSREHLISASVLRASRIYVSGFDWCLNEEVAVGLQSLVRRHLCSRHNSLLSELDEAGSQVVHAFESNGVDPDKAELDGMLFERWLLKCAINLSYEGDRFIGVGMTDGTPGRVPRYLLEVVFGQRHFDFSMGAYFLFPSGHFLHRVGEIVTTPIVKNGEIGGFYFHLRGFDIFLSLFPGHVPPPLAELGVTGLPEHVLAAKPVYRCRQLTTRAGDGPEQKIGFRWPSAEVSVG